VFSPTTNNPAFTSSSVNNAIIETQYGSRSEKPMTVDGTINKASLLLVLSMASAAATWMQVGLPRHCVTAAECKQSSAPLRATENQPQKTSQECSMQHWHPPQLLA
jgi:hypothetical protein